jgi:hypothetical protein
MGNFTWNDVRNYLDSFTEDQLNNPVEVNIDGCDIMTINGISTETIFSGGGHRDVPVLEI